MNPPTPQPLSDLATTAPHAAWLPRDRTQTAQAQAGAWLAKTLSRPPAQVAFERDAHGRPHLHPPLQALDCNWSHSGEGLLVAVGEGMRVGVDLEWERPRPRALALAERFFAPQELQWLLAQPEPGRERQFLRLWCAKEAVLKAHGHGLSFGLHRLVFAEGDAGLRLHECDAALGDANAWTVRELVPAPGYLGALAWRPHAG
ncbi:4'-phosphopantetheinyl transferase family protein [Aerolutibacter ruishenii]|uniref:4'-phosphopantetheinyl transferase n=1 Tax=Aerolutibacter ruishenii TaxID=686800 RepID=A0A562M094_9GAMM|nr:4'-phosphopantetheinyl transferase superfamily protein [Lysobacter ruishenii]TWI13339.1 4'-phosphopantetheinyl transferase [Lysobacter ruishenii]